VVGLLHKEKAVPAALGSVDTGDAHAADRGTNLRAAGLTAGAVSLFAVSDAVIKLLTTSYPTGQILFCRGVLAICMLILAVRLRRRVLLRLPLHDPATWMRSLFDFGASWTYFHALRGLPLAEATAVLFSFPLMLTGLAALVLRERVDWRRWLAVAAGMAGVLVILRPGGKALDPGAIWALAAALFIALRDLTTRYVRPAVSTESVALATTGFATLAALATAPFGWAVPDGLGAAGFATSAALVCVAFVMVVAGTRIGHLSFTAPFRYVSVPLSFFLGYLIWGQVPDALVLVGTAIVVGTGLLVLHPRSSRQRPS
jgi:drug/metabolite transporter (DMT)-like permease